MRPVKLIFKFAGGPLDGNVVSGSPTEEGEAKRYYALSHHGRVGQRFRAASPYIVDTLASEGLHEQASHHFQKHLYEVIERIHNGAILLVLTQYVSRQSEQTSHS